MGITMLLLTTKSHPSELLKSGTVGLPRGPRFKNLQAHLSYLALVPLRSDTPQTMVAFPCRQQSFYFNHSGQRVFKNILPVLLLQ